LKGGLFSVTLISSVPALLAGTNQHFWPERTSTFGRNLLYTSITNIKYKHQLFKKEKERARRKIVQPNEEREPGPQAALSLEKLLLFLFSLKEQENREGNSRH
jgi:hypothetical protein